MIFDDHCIDRLKTVTSKLIRTPATIRGGEVEDERAERDSQREAAGHDFEGVQSSGHCRVQGAEEATRRHDPIVR